MTRQSNTNPTPAEMEVFKYIAEGKRDAEIAQILGVSENTVRSRVYDAVLRIGAETRCHALVILVKDGKL